MEQINSWKNFYEDTIKKKARRIYQIFVRIIQSELSDENLINVEIIFTALVSMDTDFDGRHFEESIFSAITNNPLGSLLPWQKLSVYCVKILAIMQNGVSIILMHNLQLIHTSNIDSNFHRGVFLVHSVLLEGLLPYEKDLN